MASTFRSPVTGASTDNHLHRYAIIQATYVPDFKRNHILNSAVITVGNGRGNKATRMHQIWSCDFKKTASFEAGTYIYQGPKDRDLYTKVFVYCSGEHSYDNYLNGINTACPFFTPSYNSSYRLNSNIATHDYGSYNRYCYEITLSRAGSHLFVTFDGKSLGSWDTSYIKGLSWVDIKYHRAGFEATCSTQEMDVPLFEKYITQDRSQVGEYIITNSQYKHAPIRAGTHRFYEMGGYELPESMTLYYIKKRSTPVANPNNHHGLTWGDVEYSRTYSN